MKIILGSLTFFLLVISLFGLTPVNATVGMKDALSRNITLAQEDEGQYFEDPEQYDEPDDPVYEDEENYEDYDDLEDEDTGDEVEEPYYPEEPAEEGAIEEPSET